MPQRTPPQRFRQVLSASIPKNPAEYPRGVPGFSSQTFGQPRHFIELRCLGTLNRGRYILQSLQTFMLDFGCVRGGGQRGGGGRVGWFGGVGGKGGVQVQSQAALGAGRTPTFLTERTVRNFCAAATSQLTPKQRLRLRQQP